MSHDDRRLGELIIGPSELRAGGARVMRAKEIRS